MSEFEEDNEHESQGYKMILNVLESQNNNFFDLELDDKLLIINLLVSEHISAPELRDFQENHKDWQKTSKQDLKDCKKELALKIQELADENKFEDKSQADGSNDA